jgi:protein-S-isoprenylcysteine O-methyltransferase Ste14
MLALFRALTYAALFIGFFLIAVPQRILRVVGIMRPAENSTEQLIGLALIALGGALAVWCILTFALIGKGTPAPFDPPRKLVRAGPYRWVRNPMYIGASTVLLGTALFYHSAALLAFAAGFLMIVHIFVVLYEEPTLERTFGAQYADYRNAVRRWVPKWPF